jgi:glycopeptide antibiotics resistance protein
MSISIIMSSFTRGAFLKFSLLISSLITLIAYLSFSHLFLRITTFLHPIVVFVLLLCIFIFVFLLSLIAQKKKVMFSIKLVNIITIHYSLALLILLFFRPSEQNYSSINLKPFSTISYFLTGEVDFLVAFYNLAANIGLFVPYGLYMILLTENKKYRYYYQIFIPIIIIFVIEVLQYFTHRGSLDVDDLILNISGVYIGYLISPLLKRTICITR